MAVRIKKLSRALVRRSVRLLDMEYKPSEIAEELAASKKQILRLVSAGAPARKDAKGNYWIHGETFAVWIQKAAPKNDKQRRIFNDNEAYCLTCKAVVKFTEYRRTGHLVYGKCADSHKITRFLSSKSDTKGKGHGKGNRPSKTK